jgi:hypothetical protein
MSSRFTGGLWWLNTCYNPLAWLKQGSKADLLDRRMN